jgi:hypothetical protein
MTDAAIRDPDAMPKFDVERRDDIGRLVACPGTPLVPQVEKRAARAGWWRSMVRPARYAPLRWWWI